MMPREALAMTHRLKSMRVDKVVFYPALKG